METEISQDLLQKIYEDALFSAARARSLWIEAAEFLANSEDDQVDYFNSQVLPLCETMGCPAPLTAGYLLFQDRLFGRPAKTE